MSDRRVAEPNWRACDRCHSRKVKCDKKTPCDNCRLQGVSCTHLNPVLPKGPARNSNRTRRSSVLRKRISRTSSPLRQNLSNDLQNVSDTAFSSFEQTWRLLHEQTAWSQPGATDALDAAPSSAANTSEWSGLTWDFINTALPTLTDLSRLWSAGTDHGEDTGQSCHQTRTVPTIAEDAWNLPSSQTDLSLNETSPLNTQAAMTMFAKSTLPDEQFDSLSVSWSGTCPTAPQQSPTLPWSISFSTPEDISPIFILTLDTLIRPQLAIFFERIHAMIPVFPRAHIFSRLTDPEQLQSPTFVSLILSMVSLSLIHPLQPSEISNASARARKSKLLMDEILRLRSKWTWGIRPSVEAAATSYMIFGAMNEMGYADAARLKLKEAIGIGESLRLGEASGYIGMERDELGRRSRLFAILAITERAHALQRMGSITFPYRITHFPPGDDCEGHLLADSAGRNLKLLARIFACIDGNIVACWNGSCSYSNCPTFTSGKALEILRNLGGSAIQVFGTDLDLPSTSEAQKADLMITWQWLRNRIWRLAARHGITREDGDWELSTDYLANVATSTVDICKGLSITAMESHGAGFVEKLSDIVSIITELVQILPGLQDSLLKVAKTDQWLANVTEIEYFVRRHRAGPVYAQAVTQAVALVQRAKLMMACPM